MERWKPATGYEGHYEVSDAGNVRSINRDVPTINRWGACTRFCPSQEIKSSTNNGYRRVMLTDANGVERNHLVHRLVLEAFVGPCPKGEETRHLNGERSDNRLENQQWGTKSLNMVDRETHGNTSRGSANGNSTLREDDVVAIKHGLKLGVPQQSLADHFNVSQVNVSRIKLGYIWTHV